MSEAGATLEHEAPDDRDYEAEARELGWRPIEEFRGDPADFIDAQTFISRGETQMPILRENNRKLMGRVRRSDDEIAELRAKVDEMNGSLTTLRKMAERADEAGYQRALADAKAKQRQAVADGDVATFEAAAGEIAQIEERREEVRSEAAPPQPKGPQQKPEFAAWYAENKDWVQGDQTLANAAVAIEKELRSSDEVLSEAELWDRVTEMVQTKYPRRFAAATGNPPPNNPQGESGTPRRAASVLTPSGGAPPSLRTKTGIDGIADIEDRKAARAAFNKIKVSIPDYTEAEYMKVYTNPAADVIGDSKRRKVANGKAH